MGLEPPQLQFHDVVESPQGLVIRPRTMARTWLIEAAVWVVAAAVAAWMIVAGGEGSSLRVVGCILLVPIGIRAIVRTIRLVMTKSLRYVRISLASPRPALAGPFAMTPLDNVVRLAVVPARGDLYFSAYDQSGAVTYLTQVEPGHEADFEALTAWLRTRTGRPLA